MSDHLAHLRAQQFAGFKAEALTDQEPVFLLVPGTNSDLYHFCAKHHVKRKGYGGDQLFILAACVHEGIICGVIQVGRPVKRQIGDAYAAEIWTCAHDIVPGIRRFLFERAIRASRALGFYRVIASCEHDESLLLGTGFQQAGQHWAVDLTQPALPVHEGHERIALPPATKPIEP